MRITVNGKEYVIPSSLSEITLGQRIDFYNQYGKELDEMIASIIAMPEESDNERLLKEMEIVEFHFEKMFRTFAFFTGTTTESLKESEFVDKIANIYYSSMKALFDDEQELEPQTKFFWKGELWEISAPELSQNSNMKFGEIIDSKQIVQDLAELGAGKWEMMQKLAAIFLRKVDEPYKKSFLYDGSERMELMRDLPMDIAMQVGFFLSGSMNFYLNTLMSSVNPGLREADILQKNTSSVTDG